MLKNRTKQTTLARKAGWQLIAILGVLTLGCLTTLKVAAASSGPLFTATTALPGHHAPPLSALPKIAKVTAAAFPSPIANQEEDDAAVDALAASSPGKPATAATPGATAGDAEDLAEQDYYYSPQLIGPLHDPLFIPTASDEPEKLPQLATANDQDEPFFTGDLEPLSSEDISLPGPNDFGTLDGDLVDTSNIEDLAAYSDPDVQYDLPVVLNEQVKFFIDQYQTSLRKIFARWLARSGRFLPLIQAELAKAGMPQDLCYLPMIESGFRVNALSPAKAVGAWQFIQSTGKLYGLTVNKEIDERCDPVKSTRAAIHFLSDLYEDFQSWPLAIAAYNAGGGRIRTAVDKTGSSDFWDLAKSRYLVSETKYYVPKLLAAIIVAKNPERYGFTGIEFESPLAFETVRVPKSTHLEAVALAAGTNLEEIYSLNRQLRRAVTPSDLKFCDLCVPVGTSELISQNLPLVRATFTTKFKTHVVKKKETAARISKIYGISQKTLLKINRLRVAKLKPGLRLQIPYQVASYQLVAKPDRRVAAIREEQPKTVTQEPIRHKVSAGESLYQIARRYNVTIEEITGWNKLTDSTRLSIGQNLDIYPDNRTAGVKSVPADDSTSVKTASPVGLLAEGGQPLFYEVRDGDTIFHIARKFQTTPEQIREWNDLNNNTIHPGLRLRLGMGTDTNA